MHPVPQRSCGVAAQLLAAVVVSSPHSVGAQQLGASASLRQDARVDDRVEQRARSPFTVADPLDDAVDLGIILSVAYDDNIFLSPTAAQEDVVTRVAPHVAFSVGEPGAEAGGWLRVAYRPTAVVYADRSDQNRVDHELVWAAAWRGKATGVSGGGVFRETADPTADLGRQTERRETANTARLAWSPREKLAIELAAGQQATRYRDPVLYDSEGIFGELGIVYTHSPKTRVGLRGRTGVEQVEGAGDQDVRRLTARLEWSPREKIQVDLEAGMEHRKFDNGTDTSPVLEGRLSWRPDFATEVFAGGYRRTESSGFYPGQNYDLLGCFLGASRNLGEKWTARLEGGWERASYTRVSGAGPAGRDDRIMFVRPGIEYRINDQSAITLFYRYSRNRSDQPGFGYENHSAGIEFSSRF